MVLAFVAAGLERAGLGTTDPRAAEPGAQAGAAAAHRPPHADPSGSGAAC